MNPERRSPFEELHDGLEAIETSETTISSDEPFVLSAVISHGVTPEEQVRTLQQHAERDDVSEVYALWCRWLSQIDPREYMKGGSIIPGKLMRLKRQYLQEHKLPPFDQP